MALDVYFREDVAQILSAVNLASGGTATLVNEEVAKAMRAGWQLGAEELVDHLRIYRRGYRDAIEAVAVAFGIASKDQSPVQNGFCLPQVVAFESRVGDDV